MAQLGRILIVAGLVASGGCGDGGTAVTVVATSSTVRASRRAFEGAPPVIPHPQQAGACIQCHSSTGESIPGMGIAPANPHLQTAGIGAHGRCRQCHIFARTSDQFRESDFIAATAGMTRGERGQPLAPPTIPHRLFMHEDCNACHRGPAARPEVLCRHTERVRCQQCHVASEPTADSPRLTTAND